jgi:hypothetical protein
MTYLLYGPEKLKGAKHQVGRNTKGVLWNAKKIKTTPGIIATAGIMVCFYNLSIKCINFSY